MSTAKPLKILLADDEEIVHQTISGYLCDAGQQVDDACDGPSALRSIKSCAYDLALIDLVMPGMDGLAVLRKAVEIRPDMPAVIITGHPEVETAVAALRLGAADYLGKPIKLAELEAVLQRVSHLRTLRNDKQHVPKAARKIPPPARPPADRGELLGTSPATNQVRRQIREAVEAGCEMVLITGETGTGKEVTAREIHFQAAAAGDPFVAVSCPAFADTLLESELFGHVKGAFTGATEERAGCFEQADGGTIFLDEAGDLSLPAQAKILRVLETRSLRRVGGSEEISVQVRVIAATNTSLEELVQSGRFRRDLFYRLNAYAIHLLPLHQRRDDILPLAEHFLAGYAAAKGLSPEGFDADAAAKLLEYDFPGNARELRYLVQRAAMLCRSGPVRPSTSTCLPRAGLRTASDRATSRSGHYCWAHWKKPTGTAGTPPNGWAFPIRRSATRCAGWASASSRTFGNSC